MDCIIHLTKDYEIKIAGDEQTSASSSETGSSQELSRLKYCRI